MQGYKTKSNNYIFIAIIVLVILLIGLLIYSSVSAAKSNGAKSKVIDTTTGKVVDKELLAVYNMKEVDRIKYYFTKYIAHIEKKEYVEAYGMLDEKFKKAYYPTQESFVEYIKQKYNPIISVSYEDFQRLGEYYVLKIAFIDLYAKDIEKAQISQRFIFHETNYNEYTIAFQAE